LGKKPSFEAFLFKLIRKTINDGSFHEIIVGGISVMGEPDQSSNVSSMLMGGQPWLLVQLESNINKCFTYWRVQEIKGR
jgi:hypothetical protein